MEEIMEHELEGWNGEADKQLEDIKKRVQVLEEKVVYVKTIPIIEGDTGKEAEYKKITIKFRGNLW